MTLRYKSDGARSFGVVEADTHAAEGAAVFVGEFEAGLDAGGRVVVFVAAALAQADLQTEGEFHLVAGAAQALDGLGHLRRAADGRVDGRADLLHKLFGVVVDVQNGSRATGVLPEASAASDATRARAARSNGEAISD